jgi:hypothetical protein
MIRSSRQNLEAAASCDCDRDWGSRLTKFKARHQGKGLWTLLRKGGYQVYLVDEFEQVAVAAAGARSETFKECDSKDLIADILRGGMM